MCRCWSKTEYANKYIGELKLKKKEVWTTLKSKQCIAIEEQYNSKTQWEWKVKNPKIPCKEAGIGSVAECYCGYNI